MLEDLARMNRIAGLCLLAMAILLLLLAAGAFGESFRPRPADYTPIDYFAISCAGLSTDTTLFRFGVETDVRWAEIYVTDRLGHEQLVAIAAYEPGVDGVLIFAEVMLPSGQMIHFGSVSELQASAFAEVCQVAAAWLKRT